MIHKFVMVALWFSLPLIVSAQEGEVTPHFSYQIAIDHELRPHRKALQLEPSPPPMTYFALTLTVSPTGDVLDAEPHVPASPSAMAYWPSVHDEAMKWKFVPFTKLGRPVVSTVDESVELVPPARLPSVHVKAPELKPDSKVVFSLERTRCFGWCPAYKLTVGTDGETFDGEFFVVAPGTHHDTVDPVAVRRLAQKFVDSDFFSLDSSYVGRITDNPTYTLSISIDGHEKTVEDYVGLNVGMPAVVTELEDDVDAFAGSSRWVKGSDGLVNNLKIEKFDFHNQKAQEVLSAAVSHHQAGTVAALLQAGVPMNSLPGTVAPQRHSDFDPTNLRWLAEAGPDDETLSVLMHAGASATNQQDKDYALKSAASVGDVDVMRELIRYGANPNASFAVEPKGSELIAAAASGSSDAVREILRYHPDLETRDSMGHTAFQKAAEGRFGVPDGAKHIACLKLLAKAGSDPRTRDNQGNSALYGATTDDVRDELLKLGVDINARNNKGQTVLFQVFDVKAIEYYAKHGLDFTLHDNNGVTAAESYHRHSPQMEAAILKAMPSGPWR